MEKTQSFRSPGKSDVEIPCDHVGGQYVVHWADIEQVFPGIKHVQNGSIVVNRMKDSEKNRIVPHCIKHHPGVILDVVLSTSMSDSRGIDSTVAPTGYGVVKGLQATQLVSTPNSDDGNGGISTSILLPSNIEDEYRDTLSCMQTMTAVQGATLAERLLNSTAYGIQAQSPTSSTHDSILQSIKENRMDHLGRQLVTYMQELKEKVDENNKFAAMITNLVFENNELQTCLIKSQEAFNATQDEMKELQMQALDRLALIQNSVRALSTQNYELHEYPIPRLFIVLPQDDSNKLRLYFLCECGEHTRSTNSKIPHHIHLAKHEGYEIAHPKEFFLRYGSYILTILRMLKFGISVAGIAFPAVSLLVRDDTIDRATSGLKMLIGNIQSGMNDAIRFIEKVSMDDANGIGGPLEQLGNSNGLDGADLRQLEMFLKNKDENKVLGNLYRIVTGEGHVKWVCIDHYRENYQEQAAKAFRDTVETLGGSFDENNGLAKVILRSRVQAEQFYLGLEKAKAVYELRVELFWGWNVTRDDFKRLRNALVKTNDLIKRSGLTSRKYDFPNLRYLDLSLIRLKDDILGLKYLVAKAPNLSGLTIRDDHGYFLQVYYTIAEHQEYPITFTDQSLCIPPPMKDSEHPMASHQYMEHLVKVSGGFDTLDLDGHKLDDTVMDALVKATKNGPGFQELKVRSAGRLSESFIKNVSRIIARPELRTLDICTREDEGRVHILESIQWEHLRELAIRMKGGSLWTRVIRALIDGVKRTSGKVRLDEFRLGPDSHFSDPLPMAQDGLLPDFFSLGPLKEFTLEVLMTPRQVLSLFKSVNFSRLQGFRLWAKGFEPADVDAILDGISQATELRYFTAQVPTDLGIYASACQNGGQLAAPTKHDLVRRLHADRRSRQFETLDPTQSLNLGHIHPKPTMVTTTQSFRLLGKPDLKDIVCDQIDGENVIFWEDIEQVFPGVRYTANGNTVISMMRDSNRKRVSPPCIKHHPGTVLDVVISPTAGDGPPEPTIEKHPSGSTIDLEQEVMQRLTSALSPEIQGQLESISDGYNLITQAINDGKVDLPDLVTKFLRELKPEIARTISDRVIELQEETKRIHIRPNQQQTPLQAHIETLLMRTYELHQQSIPRLFVVLPQNSSSWNFEDFFSNKFQLFFLCECGDHTESTNSKTSHHTHIAMHDGCEIVRPEVFFRRYGSYVLATLKILKARVSEAGVIVPTLSYLAHAGAGDTLPIRPELLGRMERIMDQIICHIEKPCLEESKASKNNEAVADIDLSGLELLLTDNRSTTLGNLYRTVNAKGHVKWICIDHYREMYQENARTAFLDTVRSLGGSFDEYLGHVKVTLCSRDQADQFHLALEEAKAVYDLDVTLARDSTHSDLKRLRDAVVKSDVGMLTLNLDHRNALDSDSSNHTVLYDPIFDTMRHSSIKSVTLLGLPEDFIKKSKLLSRNEDFPNLKRLDLDLTKLGSDIPGLRNLVVRAPNLVHLTLRCGFVSFLSAYNAIAEYQTYPITFRDQRLCILPPTNNLQPTTDIKDTGDLLKILGGRIETVLLRKEELTEATLADFVDATENGSRLKELTLWDTDRNLGEQCIKHLKTIVARSELPTFEIYLGKEEARISILESVQWEHIRDLKIRMDEESLRMGPLKAVVDGIAKISGRVELEHFDLCYYEPCRPLPIAQERLLQSLVASTSLKHLRLHLLMTSNQVCSLLKSSDLSQLEHFSLIYRGYEWEESDVNAILNMFQNTVRLQTITLAGANITEEQIQWMKQRGITLSNGK
ncbi:MAG: hypothetical protein J3Q66DRAFT_430885 [Benniella sp.]|nr:MAG: hypothetical protein J3Q66DRAFT_430885 [Benniella sp.]